MKSEESESYSYSILFMIGTATVYIVWSVCTICRCSFFTSQLSCLVLSCLVLSCLVLSSFLST